MLSADELEELRALQTRAYSRGGGVTDGEARRLRDLQAAVNQADATPRAHSDAVATAAPRAEAHDAASSPESEALESGFRSDAAAAGPSSGPQAHDSDSASPRDALRRHGKLVAAASALLLVIGVGVGWALFAPRSEGVVLTDEQQQRRLELYEVGGYDDSSVRAIGQDDDALVWFATKDGEELTCLVLDVADRSSDVCRESSEATPMWLSTSVMMTPEGNGDAESDVPDTTSVSAYLVYATTGEPLAVIDRWTQADAMLHGFSGEERDRAHELFDEGYEAGLSIVGYFQGEPVWLANHSTGASFATCLVVDAADDTECGPEQEVVSQGLRVVLEEPVGTMPASWNIEVAYTRSRTPYLTITGNGEQSTFRVRDGERIELGGQHGDPIEVTIPSEPDER